MRSLKNTCCLSRGSGYNKVMQNCWTLSALVTSEYNRAMQDFTELAYTSSPQHKDPTEVRIKRDISDIKKCRQGLKPAHPTQLILFKKHCQLDSGWISCESSCISRNWEQDHKRNHWKVDLCLMNLREQTNTKLLGIAPLLRLLKTVLFILLFYLSISWQCQSLEIFPLKTLCCVN
ncbi:hypothetical protein DPMN_141832 [Dreissena polymorpha]|uniref:Uncharacterized protein n=1 Tax=Dreissena polymorpha TaxID=45954 RepID=A0A9D4GA24_DREPO|nr:hypothetical protein DPMN_141832 [Dreissena polymorpha]